MLSTKPCCEDNDCQSKEVTTSKHTGKSPIKEKECHGCSPFLTCGTCAGFVMTKPYIPGLKLLTETPVKIYAVYLQPYVQPVSLSIWQPPQLS